MIDIDTNELQSVGGGSACHGIWLGTYDGQYGVCVGYWG